MRKSTAKTLHRSLLTGTSLVALTFFAEPAAAQTAPASEVPSGQIEQVIVSASRIDIAGYQQPTPVTVVGTEQLERDAQQNLGDAIRDLPASGSAPGPNNTVTARNISAGQAGVDEVNLRNLGILRTLVLVDGQRVVASNITGGVDLSTIPSSLVQRIDVVTGGASAAWGSDAVAGVVNLVLNKNFEGLKGNVEGGMSYLGDRQSYKAEAAYGMSFAGDRGHLLLGGEYQDSPQFVFPGSRHWYNDTQLVNNPAYVAGNGQPQNIHANNVGYAQATEGGVIVGGPLNNIQFVANGTPTAFNPGNVSGLYSNGGQGDTTTAYTNALAAPFSNATLFAYGSYKLTSDVQLSLQANYGKAEVLNSATPARKFGNVTITNDNAFLPASIVATMAADHVTSFKLGTINNNNLNINDFSAEDFLNTVSVPVNRINRQLFRAVASLDGTIFGNWAWNAYYQHGEARVHSEVLHNLITANFNNAIDAVNVTAANVGTSGLPIGTIACRSTLTNPTNGCQPLDLFGVGVASQGAIKYVADGNDFELAVLNEDVASASMQGELPWALPAGPVAVAFGGEYRKEAGVVTAAALAQTQGYTVGNFAPFKGEYNVEEGFLEVDAPLLKDNFVQSVDFNGAGRITSYSTSGMVETWKLGLVSQINDDVRLRTTWSFDIRAPNLSELFAAGTATAGQAIDPRTLQPVNIFSVTEGNANLKPEQSTTISAGVVVTPHWVDGLSVSVDWYSIDIKNAIYSTGSSTELTECNAGVTYYCSQLVFGGANGALSRIIVSPLNAASQTTSGIDFQSDYRTELFSGTLNLHMVGNYTDEETQTALGIKTDYAGSLGSDSLVSGFPKFRTTLSSTYSQGPWQGTIQGRFIGTAKLNNAWGPLNVDDNSIPAVAYLDLRGAYKWTDNIQIYAAVDNALDTPPPSVPSTQAASSFLYPAIRDDIYDSLGRMYRAGIRFNF